jgi:uncharacterized protein DUF3306
MTEDFLSRWSRRKQAAQAAEQAKSPSHDERAAVPEHTGGPRAPESLDPSGASPSAPDGSRNPGAPVFDPASLPPIESITAETDIRAFFTAGVPAELTRAALRRVWTSDPKIRDFVGLADYDWDFNAPGSMAGFGPLEGADALRAQMARRIGPVTAQDSAAEMFDHDPDARQDALASDASVHGRPSRPTQIMTEDEPSQKIGTSQEGDEPMRPDREFTAAQQQQEKPDDVQSIARRRHGGALPEG